MLVAVYKITGCDLLRFIIYLQSAGEETAEKDIHGGDHVNCRLMRDSALYVMVSVDVLVFVFCYHGVILLGIQGVNPSRCLIEGIGSR